MKQLVAVCVFLAVWLVAIPARAANAKDAAIVAAMRLSDEPGYSWVATISDDARTYDINGKTTREGFSWVKMPVINSIRRRLHRSVTDTDVELFFRGNVACVIATDDGWLKPDELPLTAESDPDPMLLSGSKRRSRIGGAQGSPGGDTSILRVPTPSRPEEKDRRGYSNLQLAVSLPHEELGVIVGSHQDFNVEGDVASGTLTDIGAQLLLVRDGQKEITPLQASGTFKLWLRDGIVTKYQVRLQGILAVETPNGTKKINVQQTTDTVLKDIGTTKLDVPAQVRAKLK